MKSWSCWTIGGTELDQEISVRDTCSGKRISCAFCLYNFYLLIYHDTKPFCLDDTLMRMLRIGFLIVPGVCFCRCPFYDTYHSPVTLISIGVWKIWRYGLIFWIVTGNVSKNDEASFHFFSELVRRQHVTELKFKRALFNLVVFVFYLFFFKQI